MNSQGGSPENLSKEPPELQRSFAATAEIKVRHAELQTFSDRLGRIANQPRAPLWEKRSQLCFGVGGGATLGFLPFLAEKPSKGAMAVYSILVLGAFIGGFLCVRATRDIRAERVEQISAIKEDLDKYIISTFEKPEDAASRLDDP